MKCIFKKHLMIHLTYPNEILITGCCLHNQKAISLDDFNQLSWNELSSLRNETQIRDKAYCNDICEFDDQIEEVSLGLIKFCNFNCYHCSSKIIRDKSLFTKYDDNIEIVLNKLKSLKGLKSIDLDGTGEIFTKYNLLKNFLNSIDSSITQRIQFMTNGSLITDEILNELQEISKKTKVIYSFKFSIDGITKNTYEISRPGGNFEQTIDNFKKVLKYFPDSGVIFVVKKTNCHEADKAYSFFEELGSAYTEITADFFDKDMIKYTKNLYHNGD